MMELGRSMVFLGAMLMLIGATLWALGRWGFSGFPGDIRFEAKGVRVYFPLVTSLVLSVLLTGLVWLWQWLSRR